MTWSMPYSQHRSPELSAPRVVFTVTRKRSCCDSEKVHDEAAPKHSQDELDG